MKRLGRPILAIGHSRDYQDTSLELCKSLHRAQISSLLKYAVKEYFWKNLRPLTPKKLDPLNIIPRIS